MEFLRDEQRHGTDEEANQPRVRREGFSLKKNWWSETAERRTKRHFGREDPFACSWLAGNRRFRLGDRHELRGRKKIQREGHTKIRLVQNCGGGNRRQRMKRSAKRIFVAAILVRTVRMAVRHRCLRHVFRIGISAEAFRRASRDRRDPHQQHHRCERAEQRIQGCLA